METRSPSQYKPTRAVAVWGCLLLAAPLAASSIMVATERGWAVLSNRSTLVGLLACLGIILGLTVRRRFLPVVAILAGVAFLWNPYLRPGGVEGSMQTLGDRAGNMIMDVALIVGLVAVHVTGSPAPRLRASLAALGCAIFVTLVGTTVALSQVLWVHQSLAHTTLGEVVRTQGISLAGNVALAAAGVVFGWGIVSARRFASCSLIAACLLYGSVIACAAQTATYFLYGLWPPPAGNVAVAGNEIGLRTSVIVLVAGGVVQWIRSSRSDTGGHTAIGRKRGHHSFLGPGCPEERAAGK